MTRVGALVALALLFVVGLAAPADAHAQLVSTTPSSGAVLDRAPDQLVVRFNEGVEAGEGALRLHGGDGRRLDVGGLEVRDGGKVLVAEPGELDDGGYVLTWRVVSLDGHPISGGVTWRVGAGTAVDASLLQELLNAEGDDPAVATAAATNRAVLFASLLLAVGAVVFLLLIWPSGAADPRLVPVTRASVAVAALTTVFGMGLQDAQVSGRPLGHALSAGAVLDNLDTIYGQAAAARLLALLGLGLLIWRMKPEAVRRLPWRVGVQAAIVAVLATISLAGHARTGRWAGVALPVDVVHLLAAAVWVGGLVVLAFVVLPRDDELTPKIASRFSTVAAWAVVVVVLTGLFQSFRQLEGLTALRETTYGQLLALKVVVVAVVVVLGAVSRSLVRAPVRDLTPGDPDEVRRAVRRSVAAEALLATVVVALTSLLVAADPGRAAAPGAFEEVRLVDTTQLTLVVAPAGTGPADVHLYADDPNFGLTADLDATATMSLPARDIPPLEVPLRYAGRGHWSAYDVDVPIAGDWEVEVTVLVSEFDQREATFTVPID